MNTGPKSDSISSDDSDDGFFYPQELEDGMTHSRSRASTKYSAMPSSELKQVPAGRSRADTQYAEMPAYTNFKAAATSPVQSDEKDVPTVKPEATPFPTKKKKNRCTLF